MLYSSSLLEFYSDYKTIWKNLQVIDEAYQENPLGIKLSPLTLPTDVMEYLRTFPDGAVSDANRARRPIASMY
jgi:hypothetical protein